MNSTPRLFSQVAGLLLAMGVVSASPLVIDRPELVFSGAVATSTEPSRVTLLNTGEETLTGVQLRLVGTHAAAFRVTVNNAITLKKNEAQSVGIIFIPVAGQVGPLEAKCEMVSGQGEVLGTLALYGLAAIGYEGPREPWMSHILQTLGLRVDVGWPEHHTHCDPVLLGDEIVEHTFRRAVTGPVQMLPVARYSPDFLLPFGYYLPNGAHPELHAVGTLALKTPSRPEQNCLYPTVATGTTSFDPGATAVFGVFTSSPSHLAYSENALNAQLEPKHVAHAVRVYPAKDRAGRLMANTYLICFEEATNGDYQDYVFLLSNVVPVK